jgi:iron only hydrogenase large subunit-like protein
MIDDFAYTIALPAPSLYGQFNNLDNINIILQSFRDIGFNEVFEVAVAAEVISDYTKRKMQADNKLPVPTISSSCPAVVRLICLRYPELIKNTMHHIAPVELAAIIARDEAVRKFGLVPSDIGVFFISPCPAKTSANRNPLFMKNPVIDGTFSASDIYKRLLPKMKSNKNSSVLSSMTACGLGWANIGGEALSVYNKSVLAVDGIENVIKILDDVEHNELNDISFLELSCCTQGCVGGCLNVENPYIARSRIMGLMKDLPKKENKFFDKYEDEINATKELVHSNVLEIDDDTGKAIEKFAKIEELYKLLPGLDWGSCGTPSCRALAEDVILGYAMEDDCIFRMRERMQSLGENTDTDSYLPPPFRKVDAEESQHDR